MNRKVLPVVIQIPESDWDTIKSEVRERALDISLSSVVTDFYADLFNSMRELGRAE